MAKCISPIVVGRENGNETVVRCGQCRPCRIRRKQSWVARLLLESSGHSCGRFITLTYREETRALSVLDPRDLQLFLKRYRNTYGPFRFFAVGEYGEKNFRGHWHALIFGHEFSGNHHWSTPCWTEGYAFDGYISTQSIGYVAGYTLKRGDPPEDVTGLRPDVINARRALGCPTRMSLRPGIGSIQLERFGFEMAQRMVGEQLKAWPGFIRIGERTYPLTEQSIRFIKRGFLHAGGYPPDALTPDEKRLLVMEHLGSLGTRIQSEREQYNDLMLRREVIGSHV